MKIGAKVIKKLNINKLNFKIMKDLTINLENKKQKSMLKLINEHRVIEEVTIYLQDGGNIFKTSLEREVFNAELTEKALKLFFDSKTNALIEFYRIQGEFKITIQ